MSTLFCTMVQTFADILNYIYKAETVSGAILHLPLVPNIIENYKKLQKTVQVCGRTGQQAALPLSPSCLTSLFRAVSFPPVFE